MIEKVLNVYNLCLQTQVALVQSCSRIKLKAKNYHVSVTEVIQGKQHNVPYRNCNIHDRLQANTTASTKTPVQGSQYYQCHFTDEYKKAVRALPESAPFVHYHNCSCVACCSLITPEFGYAVSRTTEQMKSNSLEPAVSSPLISPQTVPPFPFSISHLPLIAPFSLLSGLEAACAIADPKLLEHWLVLLYANKITGQLAAASRETWASHAFPWARGIVFGFPSSQKINECRHWWQTFKIRGQKE